MTSEPFMNFIKRHLKLLVLLGLMLCTAPLRAATEEEMMKLEAEMLKHIQSKDRDTFFSVTEKLKEACREHGNERLFYRAWMNQAIYEATQQKYEEALLMVRDIKDHALEEESVYGQYAAIHAEAMVLLQKQDYQEAEITFVKAVEFMHRHFPNESAGEDLQELMRIANHRKDPKAGELYARQMLNEPNVAPIHKGRALYRLSQMAFKKNDVEEFNRIYQEMMILKRSDGIATLKPLVEVNHCIMNRDFEQALRLAGELDPVDCAERKAIIYHRMGDDANAFKFMQQYKQISDSITLVSHGNVVASCYVQMNNERLQLEQALLERENNRLLNYLFLASVFILLLLLLFVAWRGRRAVRILRKDNKALIYEKSDSEQALSDLNELSYYESKAEMELDQPFIPNVACDELTDDTQARCRRTVVVVFQTELEDSLEMKTNPDALKQLLAHLLNYSARFTEKGTITLHCAENGDNILFSVADTSAGIGGKQTVIGMFSEQNNRIRYVGMNFNICQSITRLLHGRIWHDTEYKGGTRFCVEIPKLPSQLSKSA